MIQPWKLLRSRFVEDLHIARVRADLKVSPRNGAEHEFYVLECPPWVNVIATTPDDQLVMVEQFRHGTNTVELEIPGGVVDAADASPLTAGLRELREETGFEGEKGRILSRVFPNPAIMNNLCFTVRVENCRLNGQVELDRTEDVQTRLVPAAEVQGLVREGKVRHSLVLVALYHFWLERQR